MSRWVDVGAIAEMRFDPGAPVEADGRQLAIFPLDDGYAAIDNPCPHASAPLCDGARLGDKIACMLHCWEFDLKTGSCDVGAEWDVRTYPARECDGRLLVEIPDRK